MSHSILAWGSLGLFMAISAWLAYRGYKKTADLRTYALGNQDIAPWVVGLSLAAQLTSVATFVINPGLVFAFGLSGLMGYGVAAGSGLTLGLILFSRSFRKTGIQTAALSVPQWIGARYQSRPMAAGFGVLSLSLVAFAVLIVVAIAYVLAQLLGVPTWAAALGVIIFVYGYVLLGGVNTSVYTNSVQAVIMLVVAVLLIGDGLPALWEGDGLFSRLAAQDPALVAIANPGSLYFRNLFEVFVCNFLVGLALVCQPHILSKTLLLKNDSEVRKYLGVAILAGLVFLTVLWVGLFARLQLPANLKWDLAVPFYIQARFGSGLQVLISIGLLCAGISTLEGILLALATIVSVDLYLGLLGDNLLKNMTDAARQVSAFMVGRLSIVALGAITFVLALWQIDNPTGGSVTIFAQLGVYLLTASWFVPLAAGMFLPHASRAAVMAGSAASFVSYLAIWVFELSPLSNNPSFLAGMAILVGWGMFALAQLATRFVARPVPVQSSPAP